VGDDKGRNICPCRKLNSDHQPMALSVY
jgi:hypothetical protein